MKGTYDIVTSISKTLSWILRHHAKELGLDITTDGWVNLEQLLKLPQILSKHADITLIQKVVAENDKKRFELKQDGVQWYIRAVQGHTISDVIEEGLMDLITDPKLYPIVIHGSYAKNWESIKGGGLNKMKRNHIHLAQGLPGEGKVISGMRGSCNMIIEIDICKAMADGIKFYLSKNNVILTEGVEGTLDKKYFKKVSIKGSQVYP